MVKEKTSRSIKRKTISDKEKVLMLYNDDINTFDFVIENLILICEHDVFQAEQCAITAHSKGKCQIKHGSAGYIEMLRKLLTAKGLIVKLH
jgi:ATP-dependent Clp protease adaptor protein ClpS